MSQTYNLGKVAVTPRGAYSSTAQYTPLDIFSYNGSSYLVLQNCMGVTPPNSTYYQVLAQKGTNGQNGSAANIAAGTVTMLPVGSQATVTNSGTSGNAIFNFGIPYSSISDNSVSTAKIVDSAVTTNKIADEAVTTDELQDRAVTTDKLQDRAVTTDKIADGSVSTPKIANGSVSSSKLGSDVTATLENKANVDGAYEQMTVGNAEQLVSTVGIIDNSPYNFRTSGGSVDIGDRETDKIVGGTVAWNQQMREMSSSYYGVDGSSTVNISDGVATVTPSARYDGIRASSNNLPQNIDGHKMLAVASVLSESMHPIITLNAITSSIFNPSQNWQTIYVLINADSTKNKNFRVRTNDSSNFSAFYVKNCMVFDLTAMFGSTIADYIYALEQINAGSGAAYFRKLFPQPYYEYNSGELLSVQTSAHKMVGFNQWDEEWELGTLNWSTGANATSTTRIRSKNYIPCVGDTVYYVRIPTSAVYLFYYDADKNFISYLLSSKANTTFTTPSNARYIRFFTASDAYGTTYNDDVCINLSWDGERDGEYESYTEHTYPLDSDLTLRGIPKLDASNNLYYDGDVYESDGTVTRKYGIVDLGTLDWGKLTSDYVNFYSTGISSVVKRPSTTADGYKSIICSKYSSVPISASNDNYIYITADGQIRIKDTANAALTADEFKSLMSGVYAVYELATPTTETADPYTNPQIVDDFGTEEYVDYGYYVGTRDVEVPVGHKTLYSANLRAKLEMSPNSPESSGDYLVRQTNGLNEYVSVSSNSIISGLSARCPSCQTDTDGNFVLKAVVSDGSVTYSWVSV